jgi:hypothetical protein
MSTRPQSPKPFAGTIYPKNLGKWVSPKNGKGNTRVTRPFDWPRPLRGVSRRGRNRGASPALALRARQRSVSAASSAEHPNPWPASGRGAPGALGANRYQRVPNRATERVLTRGTPLQRSIGPRDSRRGADLAAISPESTLALPLNPAVPARRFSRSSG